MTAAEIQALRVLVWKLFNLHDRPIQDLLRREVEELTMSSDREFK